MEIVCIVELFTGPDEEMRSVRIRIPDGATAVASILHLYPLQLEISQAEGGEDGALLSESDEDVPAVPLLEPSPKTETTPTSRLSSDSLNEESTHPVPRPRSRNRTINNEARY